MSEAVDRVDKFAADRLAIERREAAGDLGPPPPPPPGPIAQSVAVGFRAVYIAAGLLLIVWLLSNVHEISSGSQAVVRRFGRIVRAQEAGLLVALPRPVEEVQLLPGPERQLTLQISAPPSPTLAYQEVIGQAGSSRASATNAAPYLTGDGNVVLLDATLVYHIDNPIAYALAERHVAPALNRLFRASAVQVAAGRNLNDFLVVQTTGKGTPNVGKMRTEVREELLADMNARLQALAKAGAPLGVSVDRINVTPSLPPKARSAFDAVLVAIQQADRTVAMARTDAAHRLLQGQQQRDLLLSSAQATAEELVSNARVKTSGIVALEREETPQTRGSLLLRAYRTEVAGIISRIGSVALVDPSTGARFLLSSGNKP